MRRLFYFLLFIACLASGIWINSLGRYREVFRSICDLTEEHFYKADERLNAWVRNCRFGAAHLPLNASVETLLEAVQAQMSDMNVSHFQIYSPVEDRKLWKGETVDTGIRSRYIEDHLIVYKLYPGSAAELAGVRLGDEILALPGSDQVTPFGAQRRSGEFSFKRGSQITKIKIEPKPLVIDSQPKLNDLGSGRALLEISSFRSEFFNPPEWKKLAAKLKRYRHVIVDVRENAGGNFVAMLRALSTFRCQDQWVGSIFQPRKSLANKHRIADNTSDQYQIAQLEKYRTIGLNTFPQYECYEGRVTVLVGPETSSVAEIFAQAMASRNRSRVWGQPTAGDVVLAVWYDLPKLGPGYSVSVPEAVYLTDEGKELEGRGVYPERELYYDLNLALKGQDSWIVEALSK